MIPATAAKVAVEHALRVRWPGAIDLARRRPCRLVQLTTDTRRPKALRFYESLGVSAGHEGLELALDR